MDAVFDRAIIVYDGECPFCSRYVAMVRLRDSLGPVRLIDARQGGAVVEHLRGLSIDLDEGMVLLLDGAIHHGADSVHMLAMLSTPVGPFNRLNARIFRSRGASRVLYPILRLGRNAVLAMLGRKKIDPARG